MEKSPLTYIISEVSFDLGSFRSFFNPSFEVLNNVHFVCRLLEGSCYSDYESLFNFVSTLFRNIDCEFRFSLHHIDIESIDSSYCLLKVSFRVS